MSLSVYCGDILFRLGCTSVRPTDRPTANPPVCMPLNVSALYTSCIRLQDFHETFDIFTASRRCPEPIPDLTVSMSRSRYKVKCCTWVHFGFYVKNGMNKIDEISTCCVSYHQLLLIIYFIIIVITLYSAAGPVQILE